MPQEETPQNETSHCSRTWVSLRSGALICPREKRDVSKVSLFPREPETNGFARESDGAAPFARDNF